MHAQYFYNRPGVRKAAERLVAGGVVAYPTEGVWGLGCDPLDRNAVERILEIKSRPMHKGLILIAANLEQLTPYLRDMNTEMLGKLGSRQARPVSWICPAQDGLDWLTGGRNTLAVRITTHPVAAALCLRAGMAIVSTSANRSGKPAARTAIQVRHCLGSSVDMICPGKVGGWQGASEIRDIRSDEIIRA